MVEVNRMTTPANMRWILLDRDTGERNHGIDWRFRVGDQVKIRLVNEMDSDHPMHHPFHVHGAGRFLILSRDGTVEPNLVWKDTVLVRRGETVDILLDVTNPGVWMAHCHIAEHHESGMMFNFHVDPRMVPSSAARPPSSSRSDERPDGHPGRAGDRRRAGRARPGTSPDADGRPVPASWTQPPRSAPPGGAGGIRCNCSPRPSTTTCPGLPFPPTRTRTRARTTSRTTCTATSPSSTCRSG